VKALSIVHAFDEPSDLGAGVGGAEVAHAPGDEVGEQLDLRREQPVRRIDRVDADCRCPPVVEHLHQISPPDLVEHHPRRDGGEPEAGELCAPSP
jgi:hypothetical protein